MIVHDPIKLPIEKIEQTISDAGFDILSSQTTAILNSQADQRQAISTVTKFQIAGMTCASCSNLITQTVSSLSGVHHTSVSLALKSATITHNPLAIGPRDIIAAITDLGFFAELENVQSNVELSRAREAQELNGYWWSVVWASMFAGPMFLVAMVGMMMLDESNPWRIWLDSDVVGVKGLTVGSILTFALATPVQFGIGWRFYKGAWKAVWNTGSANV
ncbi:hypothetical protein HK096_005815, partial [Nowakowskiella sp. JEL0078]